MLSLSHTVCAQKRVVPLPYATAVVESLGGGGAIVITPYFSEASGADIVFVCLL